MVQQGNKKEIKGCVVHTHLLAAHGVLADCCQYSGESGSARHGNYIQHGIASSTHSPTEDYQKCSYCIKNWLQMKCLIYVYTVIS